MGACGLPVNLPAATPGKDVSRPSLHEFLAPERQDQGLRECLTGEPETAPPGGGPGSVVENERPNGLSCDKIVRLIGNAIFVENHRPEPEEPDSRALVKGLLVVYSEKSVEARLIAREAVLFHLTCLTVERTFERVKVHGSGAPPSFGDAP